MHKDAIGSVIYVNEKAFSLSLMKKDRKHPWAPKQDPSANILIKTLQQGLKIHPFLIRRLYRSENSTLLSYFLCNVKNLIIPLNIQLSHLLYFYYLSTVINKYFMNPMPQHQFCHQCDLPSTNIPNFPPTHLSPKLTTFVATNQFTSYYFTNRGKRNYQKISIMIS